MYKNITLSADAKILEKARKKAALQNRALNQLFREWLQHLVGGDGERDYSGLMQELSYAKPGRKFSRDEMNER